MFYLLLEARSQAGQIVNLATNDVKRFLMSFLFVLYLFWVPVASLTIPGVGYHLIGLSFAVGFGALLGLFVPLQLWLSTTRPARP